MKNTDQRQLTSDYAPYEAFWEGFVDYRHGSRHNPYDAVPTQDVECQAWDEVRKPACAPRGRSGEYS